MTNVAVVGGGPAGLMAADELSARGFAVIVFERMPSVGRKFLLAGRGGLNLTHAEPYARFVERYGRAQPALQAALDAFPPDRVRAWGADLGESTFVGTSQRVFPQSFKASPLLRAWLRRLQAQGVQLVTRHRWTGWGEDGALRFEAPDGVRTVCADATLLALGGASWPRLGADGGWVPILRDAGVAIAPLVPANCGFEIGWSEVFRDRFEGTPLKRIALALAGKRIRGEAVVTAEGLEGGAIYALAADLREAITADAHAVLHVDLRPDLALDVIAGKLSRSRTGESLSTLLRKRVGLAPVAVGLLREVTGNAPPREPTALATLIKAVPLTVVRARPLDRAISTAGGVRFDACDAHFQLHAKPGVWVAGEMLDWEAPTGGYLLTACFATGAWAAEGIAAMLSR